MTEERRALHRDYHDRHYGFPLPDDNELFGRLVMEINRAGLNREIILKKEKAFRIAFDQFNIKKVAAYTEKDRERLLSDAAIVRNRPKIDAAIENARRILGLQQEYGSFHEWLERHHPRSKEEWVKLFKKTFLFTGGEIVGEFLMSTGFLPGAHDPGCPVHFQILESGPKWAERETDVLNKNETNSI